MRYLIPLALLLGTLNLANADGAYRAGTQPLVFIPNVGQESGPVRFVSRGPGYALSFTSREAIFRLGNDPRSAGTLQLKVIDSRSDVEIAGADALPARVNYLIGNERKNWHTGIATYRHITYKKVLSGVDLVYYGHDGQLEYDFRLSPGADPARIQMAIDGGEWTARVIPTGDLEIRNAGGAIRFGRPVAYQLRADGSRQLVEADYALKDSRRFGFHVGRYDRLRELVIDPTFVYSEYYGGTGNDNAAGIARDSQGNVYIVGSTSSSDLPGVSAEYQTMNKGIGLGGNAFVAKFNASGQLVAATYLGGSNFTQGTAIAVDGSGNAIVVGYTEATDFPLQNAVQTTCGPTGSVDRFSCAYSTFSSCPSPSFHPDAFITKLDSTLSHLVYSTYFGGSDNDSAGSVTVNAAGEAFVTGTTTSHAIVHDGCPQSAPLCGGVPPDAFGVPTTGNAYMQAPLLSSCSLSGQPFWSGPVPFASTWFAKFSPTGALLYSSYFSPTQSNGGQTVPVGIALDSAEGVYLAGSTSDTGFTAIPGNTSECNNCNNSHWNGWAAKFNLNASGASQLLYSNLFGGASDDNPTGLAVDQQGNAYVGGTTTGADFPTTAGSFQPTRSADNSLRGFVTKVNELGSALPYASYLVFDSQSTTIGRVAVDNSEAAVVGGNTCGSGCGIPSVILLRMLPDGSNTSYFSFFTSGGVQAGVAVVVDTASNAYITGTGTIPTTIGNSCPNLNNCANGNTDAFVGEISMGAGPANPITATTTIANNVIATYSPNSQSITLSAGVSGGSGVNVGSVMFTFMGANFSANVVGGLASANVNLPGNTHPGSYPIQAVYVPAGSFAISSDTAHTLTVQKANPVITWTNPADIVSGTELSAAQLNATASVAGSFLYSPPAGTVLPPGTGETLSATFTPTDTVDYNTAMASVHINVTIVKVTPVITWGKPADILFGSALGPSQLNATANVPGAFVYTPAAGTVLPVGNGQTLSVMFTPTDTVDYNPVSAGTTINVIVPTAACGTGGSQGPSLTATWTLGQGGPAGWFAFVTVANTGCSMANDVLITAGKLGSTSASNAATCPNGFTGCFIGGSLPLLLGAIPGGGSSVGFGLFFPSNAAPGTTTTITVSGTYDTGGLSSSGFTTTRRVTLP